MPKVRPEYKEEIRKKIILAAIEIGDESGFLNIRMEDISSRVGISRATLYLYFKNREDLIAQANERCHEIILRITKEALEKGNLENIFSALFDNLVFPENGLGTRIAIEMFGEAIRDDETRAIMEKNYSWVRDMIVDIIEKLKDNNLVSESTDAVSAAGIIQSVGLGIKIGSVVGLDRDEAREIWKSVLNNALMKD